MCVHVVKHIKASQFQIYNLAVAFKPTLRWCVSARACVCVREWQEAMRELANYIVCMQG